MNHTVTMQQPKRVAALNIRTITMTALLSAMAYVLAFVEFPVPLSPSFAKMDLSDFPALIGAFVFGTICGLLIELVKNTLQLLTTSTGGIGEIANFLMGASYAVAAGVIYKHRKTKKTALLACVAASLVMGIAAALANYFILLPLFETFMPLDQLIASFGAFLPFIHTKLDIVLFNALPFNILKGLVIGGFTMLTYPEPTGQAKITPAFNLPCRYVLHTVGPIISGRVTKEDKELLASCYRSCLELAAESSLESVAFCCISTGEFHFPNEQAAQIAVETVKQFMNRNTGVKKVIFNVFKDLDKAIYEKLLGAA